MSHLKLLLIKIAICGILLCSNTSWAEVLILAPDNPEARSIAHQIKSRLVGKSVTISDDVTSVENPELVITLGSKLLREQSKNIKSPTLASFVSPSEFNSAETLQDVPSEAIYSIVSPDALLNFLSESFGKARVGFIYYEEKDPYLNTLERMARGSDIDIVSAQMKGGNVFKTLRRMLSSQSVDVMLIPNDSRIFNRKNIRFVLEAIYREKIPTIGFSKSLVDAGAVAAVFSNEDDIINQTIIAANNYFFHRNFPGEMYASISGVSIKKDFAIEFNIPIKSSYSIQ